MLITYAAVAIAAIILSWRLLHRIFDLWEKYATEFRPEGSALAALFAAMHRAAVRARRFILAPVPATLAILAAWATFLCAPGTAEASTLTGSASGGSLLTLLALGLAFGIAAIPAGQPAPGVGTSEFSLAKLVMIVGTIATILFGVLSQLQGVIPGGSKEAGYLAAGLAALAMVLKLATLLGYTSSRTDVKVAAAQAVGATAAAQAQASAGANAGAGAEAAK